MTLGRTTSLLSRLADDGRVRRGAGVTLFIALISFPWIAPGQYSISLATVLLINLVLVLALNVMLGYAGLLNLGLAAFAGIGGYLASWLMLRLGLSFWFALPIAVVVATAAAVVLALPTLRLRHIYLGIVTLAFGEIFVLMIQNMRDLVGGAILAGIPRPEFLGIALNEPATFYYVPLAAATLLLGFTLRLSRSRYGRAFEYVRGDQIAAESMGIDVARTKLVAYAVGSAFAGIGGVLLATQLTAIGTAVFDFTLTLTIITMVVVGGTGSIAGAVIGAAVFTLLPEALRELSAYRHGVFGVALVAMILVRPQGLVPPKRQRVSGTVIAGAESYAPQGSGSTSESASRTHLLEVRAVSKRFGGLTAVDSVDLQVTSGEVLSIIGPNGAGKTTLVDVMTGVTAPTDGSIFYEGIDVTRWRPSRRAAAGVARTFQRVRLFRDLTVYENVIAGRQVHLRSGPFASVLRTPSQRAEERVTFAAAEYWLRFVGDDLFARRDQLVENLPYGLQRRVEIARALAVEPRLLLLDEPATGLNTGEKEDLAGLIKAIHDSGVTVVLIEHDMRLVMKLSDRIVVLDEGRKIAEGDGAAIQANPRVIEAYLGTDQV
jgi:branched-chain amino acid transport system permease protein